MNKIFSKSLLFAAAMFGGAFSMSAGPSMVSAVPANGSTVEQLENVNITFNDFVNPNLGVDAQATVYNQDNVAVAYIVAEAGEEWTDAKVEFRTIDEREFEKYGMTMFGHAPMTITEPGTYTFTLPAGCVEDDYGNTNDAVTLNYTIGGGSSAEEPEERGTYWFDHFDPAAGSTVSSLGIITAYLNSQDCWAVDWSRVEILDAEGNVVKTMEDTGYWDPADYTLFQGSVSPAITAPGTYTVVFPDGVVNGPDGTNKRQTVKYTIEGGEVVVETPLEFVSITNKSGDYTYQSGKTFLPVNITFNDNVEEGTETPYITTPEGDKINGVSIINPMFGKGLVIITFEELDLGKMRSGDYVLTIPAGAYKRAGGEATNEALSFIYTWTENPALSAGGEDDTTPLKLEEMWIQTVDADGNVNKIDLLNCDSLAALPRDSQIFIMTNKNSDETVQALRFAVYAADQMPDEDGEYAYVWNAWTYDSRQTATTTIRYNGKNADGYFVFDHVGQDDLMLGTCYNFFVGAYNWYEGNPADRVERGSVEIQIEGATKAFEYSTADIMNITPAPGSEFENPDNNTFVITYSEPVELVKFIPNTTTQISGSNHGTAGWVSYVTMTPNPDKTVWTITIPKKELEDGFGVLDLCFAARDMQGRPVFKENEDYTQAGVSNRGYKESATQCINMYSYLSCPKVKVTPESGSVVEKLYSFKFEREDQTGGQLDNIDWQGQHWDGSKFTYPELRTKSGAVVTTFAIGEGDMEKDATNTGKDDYVKSVTLHLQKEVTAPGKYILYIPSATFIMGTEYSSYVNAPQFFEFIIEGDAAVSAASVKENSNVRELGLVSLYAGEEVELAQGAKMQVRRKGSTRAAKEAELRVVDCGTYFRVDADFSDEANAFAPYVLDPREEGQAYELVIEKGQMLTAEGAPFAQVLINVFCPAGEVAETVALTTHIAGHHSNVANVLKGSTATINLTPAEGWSIDTVTLDDLDVTNDVTGNVYTTPVLEADAELVANYKYDGLVEVTSTNGVVELEGSELKVRVEDNKAIISGCEKGDVVMIYTINGSLINRHEATEDTVVIYLEKGTYVVTINGQHAVKVIL